VASGGEVDLAGVRRALRGRLGCERADLHGLTPDERRACEARRMAETARGRGEAAPKLDLDPRGAFARDDAPYLARKPKDGCKLMAGGRASPSGEDGPAAGIGCSFAF
jgi:hypothetical protein